MLNLIKEPMAQRFGDITEANKYYKKRRKI